MTSATTARLVIVGGSDAAIMAGLRARQVNPAVEPLLVLADAYPNFSICGIPYHVSGEVPDWRDLAHRSRADLKAAGLHLRLAGPRPRTGRYRTPRPRPAR